MYVHMLMLVKLQCRYRAGLGDVEFALGPGHCYRSKLQRPLGILIPDVAGDNFKIFFGCANGNTRLSFTDGAERLVNGLVSFPAHHVKISDQRFGIRDPAFCRRTQ